MQFDDELETMLSLTQTFSFWDDGDGDNNAVDDRSDARSFGGDDATYATADDDESFSGNSLESASTFGGGGDGRRSYRHHHNRSDSSERALVACGEGIEDASNVFMDTIVVTGRAISAALQKSTSSSHQNKNNLVGKFFMSKEEREQAKKEKMKRLEEERRVKCEEQLREEMRTARDEVGKVANLWRER